MGPSGPQLDPVRIRTAEGGDPLQEARCRHPIHLDSLLATTPPDGTPGGAILAGFANDINSPVVLSCKASLHNAAGLVGVERRRAKQLEGVGYRLITVLQFEYLSKPSASPRPANEHE